jgi:hypothetical protein
MSLQVPLALCLSGIAWHGATAITKSNRTAFGKPYNAAVLASSSKPTIYSVMGELAMSLQVPLAFCLNGEADMGRHLPPNPNRSTFGNGYITAISGTNSKCCY